MSLEERLDELRREEIFSDCFLLRYYDVTPMGRLKNRHDHPDYSLLRKAHCIDFVKIGPSDIQELRNITRKVVWGSELCQ